MDLMPGVDASAQLEDFNNIDFLSNCSSLPRILYYLDSVSVINCKTLKKQIYHNIHRCWSDLKKIETDIYIKLPWSTGSTLNQHEEILDLIKAYYLCDTIELLTLNVISPAIIKFVQTMGYRKMSLDVRQYSYDMDEVLRVLKDWHSGLIDFHSIDIRRFLLNELDNNGELPFEINVLSWFGTMREYYILRRAKDDQQIYYYGDRMALGSLFVDINSSIHQVNQKILDSPENGFLLKSPSLPLICSFLNQSDIIRCMKVNRPLRNTIVRDWNSWKKIDIQLQISCISDSVPETAESIDAVQLNIYCARMHNPIIRISNGKVKMRGETIHKSWISFFRENGATLKHSLEYDDMMGTVIQKWQKMSFRVETLEIGLAMVLQHLLPFVRITDFTLWANSKFAEKPKADTEKILDSMRFLRHGGPVRMAGLGWVTHSTMKMLQEIGYRQLDLGSFLTENDMRSAACKDVTLKLLADWQAGKADFEDLWASCYLDRSDLEILDQSEIGENFEVIGRKKDNQRIQIYLRQSDSSIFTLD